MNWVKVNKNNRTSDMPDEEKFVEDLVAGAWDRHSHVESERTGITLNRAGEIREAYFEDG